MEFLSQQTLRDMYTQHGVPALLEEQRKYLKEYGHLSACFLVDGTPSYDRFNDIKAYFTRLADAIFPSIN